MTASRNPQEFSTLAELAISLGVAFEGGANRPVALDEPDTAWYVEHGTADVFMTHHQAGSAVSGPRHLLRAETPRLLFGMRTGTSSLHAVAKSSPGSRLWRLDIDAVERLDGGRELAHHVDWWVAQISADVASRIEPRPAPDRRVAIEDEPADVGAGNVVSAPFGSTVWVRAQRSETDQPGRADASYLGTERLAERHTGIVPLTSSSWLTVNEPVRIASHSAHELARSGELLGALSDFHDLARGSESLNRLLALADQVNEQTDRSAYRHQSLDRARRNLHAVVSGGAAMPQPGDGAGLTGALAAIGRHEGIEFTTAARGHSGTPVALTEILDVSRVRARRVMLRSQDRWWRADSGALLGARASDGSPLALLPSKLGGYRLFDPVANTYVRLTQARAAEIQSEAWSFVSPLPDAGAASAKDLWRLARTGMAAHLWRFVVSGLAVSGLTFVPAAVTGMLAAWVLPTAATGAVWQLAAVLAVFAVLASLLQVVGGMALMRIEGQGTTRIVLALWDRLLNLPTAFFRDYTAGELATRMSTLSVLRDRVIGIVATAVFSLVFLVPTLLLLFAYDTTLAWASVGLATVSMSAVVGFGTRLLAPQRDRHRAARRLSGQLLQFVGGIGKLRQAGAEGSAFAQWAHEYRSQQVARRSVDRVSVHLVALGSALPAISAAVLYGVTLWRGTDQVAAGDFLVVFTAAATFFAAVRTLGLALESIAIVLPAYEQVKPVLAATPEQRPVSSRPVPKLSGAIQFERVSFQYGDEGRQILSGVSLDAHPGEFIAIVGESGAGKSTLLRLALGLEDPRSGGVYYDGRNLATLDRRAVRRQIGVVTQGATLQPGSILENIIGMDSTLTLDDAWSAARKSFVADDIEAMPMGMFTPITDNSTGFSGGQVQRIKIAAALARKPRILFLDEATSWLDAVSQAQVMSSIEALALTRIVIAHRVSTLCKAERIYVLEGGRIVQQGGYEALLDVDGPFRDLVLRQLL